MERHLGLKTWVISSFREIFLYHYRSLEFRAKLFALVIAAGINDIKEFDFKELKVVASEIYPQNEKRQEIFLHATKEYIERILANPKLGFDDFVKDIDFETKVKKELKEKINLEHIKRFLKEDIVEEKKILQLRIYEFFEELAKE